MFVHKVYTSTFNYYPEFGGNRDLEEKEQFFVVLEPLSKADMDRYARSVVYRESKGSRKERGMQSNQAEVQRRIFIDRVQSVKNFAFDFDNEDEPREAKSIAEFYDHGPTDLIEEILEALQNNAVLEEGKKKA